MMHLYEYEEYNKFKPAFSTIMTGFLHYGNAFIKSVLVTKVTLICFFIIFQ